MYGKTLHSLVSEWTCEVNMSCSSSPGNLQEYSGPTAARIILSRSTRGFVIDLPGVHPAVALYEYDGGHSHTRPLVAFRAGEGKSLQAGAGVLSKHGKYSQASTSVATSGGVGRRAK